jgi:pimeloyl-ACP methyl ester carboxylesterase
VPTALIYGSEDELFTPEWERFVAHDVLGVEPVVIPTGHFPMAEDPQLVTGILERLAADAVE